MNYVGTPVSSLSRRLVKWRGFQDQKPDTVFLDPTMGFKMCTRPAIPPSYFNIQSQRWRFYVDLKVVNSGTGAAPDLIVLAKAVVSQPFLQEREELEKQT